MTTRYRQAVRELGNIMKMGDLEIADFYNNTFGESVPGPIYKYVRDPQAARLISAMSRNIEARETRRERRN